MEEVTFDVDELVDAWRRSVSEKSAARRKVVARRMANADPSHVEERLRGRVVILPGNQYGRFDHYHHFLVGYFVPSLNILAEMRVASTERPIIVADCGPLMKHWDMIDGLSFEAVPRESIYDIAKCASIAFTPEGFDRFAPNGRRINDAVRNVRGVLGVGQRMSNVISDRPRILVVGRGVPDDYYEGHSVGGGGARRRSIPNLEEIALALDPLGQVTRVNFEDLSLKEQIEAVGDSEIVVMQHGAGMANAIWAHPGTAFIEIATVEKLPNFRGTLKALGLIHHQIVQESSHAPVPSVAVTDAVRSIIGDA